MKRYGKPNFNEAQKRIVEHREGACLVTACAGSGKTFSLINRTKALVNEANVSERDITIVTFTKNSASDLIEKLKEEGLNDIRVGTFHSICSRILVANNLISFGGGSEIRDYEVDNIWTQLNNGEKTDCMDIRSFISFQKAYNIRENDKFVRKETFYDEEFLRKCYREYEAYKNRKGALDFDDILIKAYDLFEHYKGTQFMDSYRTKYIMVDEHQDSNLIQNLLIPHLCSTDNIMCIGDVRQTLYSFRGSTPQQFLNFTQTYPKAKVVDMNINYRSRSNIIERVNKFANNWYVGELFSDTVPFIKEKGRIVRKSVGSDEAEAKYVVDEIEKLLNKGVNPKDIAIIYRLNETSSLVEMMLKQRGIKYNIDSEGSFFKIKEIRAILCVLRLIHSVEDNMAYEEVFNTRMGMFKFLPSALMNNIREVSNRMNCSYLEASEFVNTPKAYQKQKLLDFSRMIVNLRNKAKNQTPLPYIINGIVNTLCIEEDISSNPKYDAEKRTNRLNCIKALNVFTRNSNIDSFLSFAYGNSSSKKEDKATEVGVRLMTVHKSKGLEWENVFFIGHGDKFPNSNAPIEDEANIFYVGTTRAKVNLWVTEVGLGSLFINQFCQV